MMIISTTDRTLYLKKLPLIILSIVAIFALSSLLSVNAQKVRPDTASPKARTILHAPGDQPLLLEYRGVTLGMTAQEVRLKLGEPADKSDEQDFYNFSETESAQVFYDASGRVKAVSAHFSGVSAASAPIPKTLFGEDATPRADGSVYKLVRYEGAGCWVSYSRTAGDQPLITVSMQKSN
ncbi:MAG: hypothetical protein QOH49_5082 [Acidobacteriota bacterium]|jgi:hypothetical protein|nr:hypothetical protein [Acidobacteriota bacterium]